MNLGKNVDIGDATKEQHHDDLSADQDYIQGLADVEHDFDPTTGTGKHRAITQHSATIGENISIATGFNALTVGPATISAGVTVTLGASSIWTVIGQLTFGAGAGISFGSGAGLKML